jgi:DNA-binding CsgD family transcriptional regulator
MVVLTGKQYEAWKLVVFDGFPKKQAARILQVAPATLKGHLLAADLRLYADERFRELAQLEAGGELNDGEWGDVQDPGTVQAAGTRRPSSSTGSEGAPGVSRGGEPGAEAA